VEEQREAVEERRFSAAERPPEIIWGFSRGAALKGRGFKPRRKRRNTQRL
jgi:hypothetical protein